MSLQNRVDPWGVLNAVPSKAATRMGNRGILHNESNAIVRPWAHKAWVSCLLSFKDIKRPRPFSAGQYSELFFLDEATAFSAGHRPCAYCQRERHMRFKEAWLQGNVDAHSRAAMRMPEIDRLLHADRVVGRSDKRTYTAGISTLPVGTMFERGGSAFVVSTKGYLPWSFDGYGEATEIGPDTSVTVLTPQSIVRAFLCGFVPQLHTSAD